MKVLILNIDHNYRSVYTGLIGACLLKKIPQLKLTALVSCNPGLLISTKCFENVFFFDTESFFHKTRKMQSHEIEAEMIKFLEPVKGQTWDVIINLSSNLLGSLLVSFIPFKEIKGTSLDTTKALLSYSDQHSYFLTSSAERSSSFFHFTFYYRSMLKRFEDVALGSFWERNVVQEFDQFVQNFRQEISKPQIVLIDARSGGFSEQNGMEKLAELYKLIHDSPDLQPLFLVNEQPEVQEVIQLTRNYVHKKIYAVSAADEAQLSVISLASVVITSDLYLKSIADLRLLKTILISKNLILSDFSIVPKSLQFISDGSSSSFEKEVFSLLRFICPEVNLSSMMSLSQDLKIYETFVHNNLALIRPVGFEGCENFAEWWLGMKFFASAQDFVLPALPINKTNYLNAISRQRLFDEKDEKSLYSITLDMAQAEIKRGGFLDKTKIFRMLNNFLDQEESSLRL